MPNSKSAHTHKFKRHRFNTGNVVYFCALPDCKVKIATALALGKRSLCWRCGEPFVLNEYSIRLAKPHCDNCHKPKVQRDASEAEVSHYEYDAVNLDNIPPIALETDESIVEDLPEDVRERINDAIDSDAAARIKQQISRLNHTGLIAKPDDEEEI